MKKVLSVLFILPFLLGCNKKETNTYKFTLESDESGELTLSDPSEMYQKAKTDKIDCVFYIGDDSCSACQKLKPQLTDFVKAYKLKIYYIPLTSITEENVSYLYDATMGPYQWAENSSVPTTYFFAYGDVIFRAGYDNTVKYLLKNVNLGE